jgi:hypothetical protein
LSAASPAVVFAEPGIAEFPSICCLSPFERSAAGSD